MRAYYNIEHRQDNPFIKEWVLDDNVQPRGNNRAYTFVTKLLQDLSKPEISLSLEVKHDMQEALQEINARVEAKFSNKWCFWLHKNFFFWTTAFKIKQTLKLLQQKECKASTSIDLTRRFNLNPAIKDSLQACSSNDSWVKDEVGKLFKEHIIFYHINEKGKVILPSSIKNASLLYLREYEEEIDQDKKLTYLIDYHTYQISLEELNTFTHAGLKQKMEKLYRYLAQPEEV